MDYKKQKFQNNPQDQNQKIKLPLIETKPVPFIMRVLLGD